MLIGAWLGLSGCASGLPRDVQRPVSSSLERPQDTRLGAQIQQARLRDKARAGSGFYLLAGAQAAYGSRLALVEQAQATLDLQYYAIHADSSTERLLRAVVDAAQRGVRVRVLLDDFHSTGLDAQVMRLAFVPNIEMRMFNPLTGSRASVFGRAWSLLTDFQRAQQRMHNKLFIADNMLGVIGGRNLGDAYFDAATGGNFVDLDVLAAGTVVADLSRSFDSYWNNTRAYPVASLISLEQLKRLQNVAMDPPSSDGAAAAPAPPAPAPENAATIWDQRAMDLQQVPWIWAPAAVLVDRPGKIALESGEGQAMAPQQGLGEQEQAGNAAIAPSESSRPARTAAAPGSETGTLQLTAPPPHLRESARPVLQAESVVDGLLALLEGAQKDLLVVSPYFVPGQDMLDVFRQARQRGVRVRILTNSLASNDAPLAHAGYARHRKQLLAMGVEIHELRSTPANLRSALQTGSSGGPATGATGASRAMLHSKLVVVDQRLVVVGSMNLDLRSQLQNTEIALLIASRQLSRLATQSIDEGLADNTWQVLLDMHERLVWKGQAQGEAVENHSEPDASWALRLMLRLIGPLAPDHLL